MERYEKTFLFACAAVLVIFLCALGYGSLAMGVHLPSHGGMIYCAAGQKLRKVLRKTPPFDQIGVSEISPGKYQAVVIAQTWSFTPDEIDVPLGAEVRFVATSAGRHPRIFHSRHPGQHDAHPRADFRVRLYASPNPANTC